MIIVLKWREEFLKIVHCIITREIWPLFYSLMQTNTLKRLQFKLIKLFQKSIFVFLIRNTLRIERRKRCSDIRLIGFKLLPKSTKWRARVTSVVSNRTILSGSTVDLRVKSQRSTEENQKKTNKTDRVRCFRDRSDGKPDRAFGVRFRFERLRWVN